MPQMTNKPMKFRNGKNLILKTVFRKNVATGKLNMICDTAANVRNNEPVWQMVITKMIITAPEANSISLYNSMSVT